MGRPEAVDVGDGCEIHWLLANVLNKPTRGGPPARGFERVANKSP
jgi:hypothetical protein